MEILTLLKANIKHKKGAFKSVAIFMIIISMSLTVMLSFKSNIKNNLTEAHKNADSGDIVASYYDENINENLYEKILENKNVERVKDVEFICPLKCYYGDESISTNMLLFGKWDNHLPVYNDNNSGFKKNPEDLKSGEIYLPIAYQSLFDCKMGKRITMQTNHGDEEFIIKGFIEEPFHGSTFMGVHLVFISPSDYDRISDLGFDKGEDENAKILKYHQIHVYQKNSSDISVVQLKRELNKSCKFLDNANFTLSLDDSMMYTQLVTNIGMSILTVFIILLFAIVMIVMGHSISTGIEMDYVNLGVLKSQGFTKGQIRKVFILQYEIAQIIGTVVGMLLAIPLTRLLGSAFQPITGIHASSSIDILESSLLILGMLVISGIFIFIKTAKVSKISPVRAISGARETVYFDSRLNLPISKKGLSSSLAFRQFTSNKRQYIGTIIIVAILVFFMMTMTILSRCLSSTDLVFSFGNFPCDIEFDLTKDYKPEDYKKIEDEISKITPIKSSTYLKSEYVTINGYEIYCLMLDKPESFRSMLKGREPRYDNEIIITEIVAQTLDLKIGDTVTISSSDGEGEYLIVGYNQSTNDVGMVLGMNFDGAKKLGYDKPRKGTIELDDSEKAEEIANVLNEKFPDILNASKGNSDDTVFNIIQLALNALTAIIYVVSVFFAMVVVNMVCSKTFLKEKQNIGIYKSLGFTVTSLRFQFAIRFLIISILGSAFGILLCSLFSEKLLNALLRNAGITNFPTSINSFTIIAPVTLACVCFFVFSYIASRKIKTVAVKFLVTE